MTRVFMVIAGAAGLLTPGPAVAADVTLRDAVRCKDFKHNADGSWYADSASLSYGPPGQQQQMNFFGTTIKKRAVKPGEPDMWALLDEKCGGH